MRIKFQQLINPNSLLFIVITALALALRFSLRSYPSLDFLEFGRDWYWYLRKAGFEAFSKEFYNYTPLYLYLLYFVSLVRPSISAITAIKLPSILADFILAGFAAKIVKLRYSDGLWSALAYFAILFAPTSIINGSFWGQTDSLYTAALIACLYYLLIDRQWIAMLAFGIAIAFKAQALFILPLIIILLIKGRLKWKPLLIIPAVYLLSILPTWIAGRQILDLLTIYFKQAETYRHLTMNAPNIYVWLPDQLFNFFNSAGIIFCTTIIIVFMILVVNSRQKVSNSLIIHIALLSTLLMPFFLPQMHERYFYPADMISILYAFYYPKYFYIAIIINLVSFFAYLPFLFKIEAIPPSILALALLSVIIFLAYQLIHHLYDTQSITLDQED